MARDFAAAVFTSPLALLCFFDTVGVLNSISVGALPDMLTFTPDGQNGCQRGEPSDDYTIDLKAPSVLSICLEVWLI